MKRRQLQFTTDEIIWSVFWIAISLALWGAYLDARHESHTAPVGRICVSLLTISICGSVGTLFGRPVRGALLGLVMWLLLIPFWIPMVQAAR
jgi:hypothetical protein